VLTVYGAIVLTFMMLMYAFERRHTRFVLGFALGCALSASYGFLSGTWPFGVVEVIWCVIALRRFYRPTVPLATN
jgi:dolichyl-phosphate-mannose--protein O-mannosyl transferase